MNNKSLYTYSFKYTTPYKVTIKTHKIKNFAKLLGPTSPNYLGQLLQRPGPCCIKQSANLALAGMLRARQRRGCVCCIKVSQIASTYARRADLRSSFLGTQ